MQIVIDIPDRIYKIVQNRTLNITDDKILENALKNGTPLPKGHGRLIDADEAIKTLKSLGNRDYRREKGTIQEAIKMLDFDEYTPTVIETESEDKE
jgi:hypothetical protein